jgi:hypothetical protein
MLMKAPRELEEMVKAVTKEQVLENLYITLAREGRYKDCIKEKFLDMDVILRFQLDDEHWIPVTDGFLISKCITPGEAWLKARMPEVGLADYGSMIVMGYMTTFGAVGMMDEDKRRIASEAAGGSFYALPSSVHEFIVFPDSDAPDLDCLRSMVYDANRCGVVDDKDILSDHVYHYDCESDELSIVA